MLYKIFLKKSKSSRVCASLVAVTLEKLTLFCKLYTVYSKALIRTNYSYSREIDFFVLLFYFPRNFDDQK